MIPKTIAELFWDINPASLDIQKHERIIIPRVLNYGTLLNWQWLAETYSKAHVKEMLGTQGRTSVREGAARLAGLLFT